MVLALMDGWSGIINDVKGTFLKGNLDQKKEQVYMKVPQVFENYYAADVLLLLLKAIYGNNQAEMTFWKEILKCIMHMKYKRNGADPCMYFENGQSQD